MDIGTGLTATDLTTVPERARQLEDLGYDAASTGETQHDPFFPLLLGMEHTQRMRFSSLAIAFPRSPYVTANMAWDLSKFSGGRFVLGLGTQVKGHNERRFSVPWVAPGPRIRDYVNMIRAVWDSWQNGTKPDFESDHYQYKLRWLAQLRRHVDTIAAPDGAAVVMGDFNIAPEDRDVYDPSKFVGATHTSPAERALLAELHDWGMVDVFRERYDEDRLYSWWDYRAGDFHQGRGLRIDLVLATRSVADRVAWSVIDRNARKGTSPSDHAPVVVDLAESAVGA